MAETTTNELPTLEALSDLGRVGDVTRATIDGTNVAIIKVLGTGFDGQQMTYTVQVGEGKGSAVYNHGIIAVTGKIAPAIRKALAA
ncbi:hypothetical protein COV81_04510 [Candidatus Peregrinibacteria bacterium CG11_big_fil_rev_8_21_14_0_20_41_10]|nr:MAG: hypothetical protein COV81_04510 [Candidatus Peregrinibacteria bacterium CG11_big_fil_rev_8_21_14_0_20_41_10]PIZ77492.1 MAG: hypothetical protein COY06_00555 [Candidatus Peregrinibacteria bacterium CG_4_10_14_0_2_um_filter_41_8]PJC38374.1 MAG: hypothetical protein CO045_00625 [Candidatus Peregrinibacteria bacterium CG_4_9_14_0_2_um_filter_41_14]